MRTGEWEIGWPGRLSRHNLIYRTPPTDPTQGIPLGNGDLGALIWCDESRIIIVLNKCDLWDDAKFKRFRNWNPDEEERSTTLRHGCRIILDFRIPVFDVFYLSDFKGELSLAEATLTLRASGPFGAVSFRAFLSHDEGILCCSVDSRLKEDSPTDIVLERYGSRTFSHWYSLVRRDARIGLKGTGALASRDLLCVTHRLTSGTFAAACRMIEKEGLKATVSRDHSRAVRLSLSGNRRKKFSFMATVTPPLRKDPVKAVKAQLEDARKEGRARLLSRHKKAWKSFWLRSLMESGDDYLDNLWHFTMYSANASQRGPYPGRFTGGLWSWNRDVQQWNFFFHWNQQQLYWPLLAAGHNELLKGYLEYRFRSLPYAKKDAKDLFGAEGAWVSDVCDRRGCNSESEILNHTPVAEIAMEFWRYYRFTGDMKFLKERALPFILEAAAFFASLFEKGEDGLYHAKEGTGYEGWIRLRDSISELACAKSLFNIALRALEEAGVKDPRSGRWAEISKNLAPLPVIRADASMIRTEGGRPVLNIGSFKGEPAQSREVLAAGFGIEEKKMLLSMVSADRDIPAYTGIGHEAGIPPLRVNWDRLRSGDLFEALQILHNPLHNQANFTVKRDTKPYNGIFPCVEFASVFPSGLIGLAQKGSRIFQAAVNTAKLYAPATSGIDPSPIVLARLGLGSELSQMLEQWPENFQFYPNGFTHWGMDIMKAESSLPFKRYLVRDANISSPEEREKRRFLFGSWPFRHISLEAMNILACAMNESLLQSHEGIIRVAPAVPPDSEARFTLHAEGGFVVSAEIREGKPLWIAIRSKLGKTCRIARPWPKAYIFQNGKKIDCRQENFIEFPTKKGDLFLIVPDEGRVSKWETTPVRYEPNKDAKVHSSGRTMLGLPRMF